MHLVFHVSNLRKCLADEELQVPLEDLQINKAVQFVEKPVEIMDQTVKRLRRSKIPIVKVRWEGKCGAEFTWELKSDMKAKYPHLFEQSSSKISGTKSPKGGETVTHCIPKLFTFGKSSP